MRCEGHRPPGGRHGFTGRRAHARFKSGTTSVRWLTLGLTTIMASAVVSVIGAAAPLAEASPVASSAAPRAASTYTQPNGYWLMAADGGVFTFGNPTFHGSMGGIKLNAPVVGGVRTPSSDASL